MAQKSHPDNVYVMECGCRLKKDERTRKDNVSNYPGEWLCNTIINGINQGSIALIESRNVYSNGGNIPLFRVPGVLIMSGKARGLIFFQGHTLGSQSVIMPGFMGKLYDVFKHILKGIKMESPVTEYSNTADALVSRIVALIPNNKKILDIESAWDLFKVPGFKCDDLGPSLFQAQWALGKAKTVYKNGSSI